VSTDPADAYQRETDEYEAARTLLQETLKAKHEAAMQLAYWLLWRDSMGRLEEVWAHAHSIELMDAFRQAAMAYEAASQIWERMYRDRHPDQEPLSR
jgi:hypothetical protein